MAGVDLNRRWDSPDRFNHPTIYHTKEMVKQINKCRNVFLVCDLHGHSRKEGVFMYGCDSEEVIIQTNHDKELNMKSVSVMTLPQILHQRSNFFKLEHCNFRTVNCKAPTMRSVMCNDLNISCSYSMETSLGGVNGIHFTIEDLLVSKKFVRKEFD